MTNQVFLHPGDFYFAENESRIETILGSCVALTMRDPLSGCAAMCHCLLPEKPQTNMPGETDWDCFRYVDTCIDGMLSAFRARAIPFNQLEIKLFGGANVIEGFSEKNAIGAMNWQQAKRLLLELNLSVLAHDVGGKSGRRIIFETASGDVLVKLLSSKSQLSAQAGKR